MSSSVETQPTAEQDGYRYNGESAPPLDKKQLRRLHFLGYKDAHIEEMGLQRTLQVLEQNIARPGSKAAIQQNLKSLAGLPPPAGIDRFSDEALEERAAKLPESSGVQVTRSEFTNQCLEAAENRQKAGGADFYLKDYSGRVTTSLDPLNAVLTEMEDRFSVKREVFEKGQMVMKKFPTRRFRWQHPNEPPTSGPAWDPVYKPNGELYTNGELFLAWMPQEMYERGILEPQMERNKRLTAAIERNKSDKITSTGEGGQSINEGVLSTEKSEAFYAK